MREGGGAFGFGFMGTRRDMMGVRVLGGFLGVRVIELGGGWGR